MVAIDKCSISKLFIITTFIISFFGCESRNEVKSSNIEGNETAKMIQLVKEATEKIDPQNAGYIFNKERAEYFKNLLPHANTLADTIQICVLRAYELLSAGLNETAIKELEELLAKVEGEALEDSDLKYNIRRLLALNYYRLAEVNNCIENPNTASCIFPIGKEGVYKITQSSRRAIQLFEEILLDRPDDYESIWMLNLAYMTLGDYPEKVPSKWRLPDTEFTKEANVPRFKDVGAEKGLNVRGLSGGAIADDFNSDGFVDIITSSWGLNDQIRYFENDGKGNFVDKTVESGLKGVTGGLHLVHADYDNNGYLDFMILRGAWFGDEGEIPNSLIRNNGDGTFTDVTISSGLLSYHPTQTAVWIDFNNDGWIDLFIGNESNIGESNRQCELYINQGLDTITGNVTFKNRIQESGLDQLRGMIKGVTSADVNNDGKYDLYVSMLDRPNVLLLNRGTNTEGGLIFEDVTAQTQTGEPINSFPCWFWDIDNDGWEDIFVSSFSMQGKKSAAHLEGEFHFGHSIEGTPAVYRNPADWKFERVDSLIGMVRPMFTMGSSYGDINNDGFDDAYFGTGTPSFASLLPNVLVINDKGKRFIDATTSSQLGHLQKGHGVAFADFDLDGDLDIYIVLGGAYGGDEFSNALFINELDNDYSYLSIRLEGTKSNRAAIGARVRLKYLDGNGMLHQVQKRVSAGGSFGGNCLTLHFGLADAVEIFDIKILWPNSERTLEVFTGLEMNQRIKIVEGTNKIELIN